MEVVGYHKISGPFTRHTSGPDKNKVIPWSWSSEEFGFLKDVDWNFTEKIDGTNIRVIWDGFKPEFRGRTDNAQFPPKLYQKLQEMFPEEVLEQTFQDKKVILFGEGYGANIQKGGGLYRKEPSFILFDVLVGDWWLRYDDVVEISESLGIDVVPPAYVGTLTNAILELSDRKVYSKVSEEAKEAEGWVGTPSVPLLARSGKRIIVKLKSCDLYGLDM